MLNRHEKFAVSNLILGVTGILLFILIWQIKGITTAPAGFAIIGLTGFVPLVLFYTKKNSSEIIEDERDRAIKLKSSTGGYSFAWAYFIIVSLAIYFTHSNSGVISINYIPPFVWFGWAIQLIASSIITLVQYRRGTNCGTC